MLSVSACAPDAAESPEDDAAADSSSAAAYRDPAQVDVTLMPVFHRAARRMELAGTAAPDSVVLGAYGYLADSLVVRMDFFVDGQRAFRRSWWSAAELTDQDSVPGEAERLRPLLVARLEEALTSVAVVPLDADVGRLEGYEPEVVERIDPRPRSQVTFGYGDSAAVGLAFDPAAHRLQVIWERR